MTTPTKPDPTPPPAPPPPTPPAPGAGDGGESGRIHSIQDLSDRIDEVFNLLRGRAGRRGGQADDDAAVSERVKSEVARLREADAAEARRKGDDDRIGKIEEGLKAITERPPVEYRKVTRFMWGDPDDDR